MILKKKVKRMRKNFLLGFFIFLLFSVFFGITSYTKPEEVYNLAPKEEILKLFEEPRLFEWIEKYEEKSDAIYILTNKKYYRVRYREGEGIIFETAAYREDYDRVFSFWVIMVLLIFSGGGILIVILSSVSYKFPKRKKSNEINKE